MKSIFSGMGIRPNAKMRPYYLDNGNPHTGKTVVSLYWKGLMSLYAHLRIFLVKIPLILISKPIWQVSFKKEVVVRVNDLVFWLTVWLNFENVLLTFKWYVFVWQKCFMLTKYANGHFFNKWMCFNALKMCYNVSMNKTDSSLPPPPPPPPINTTPPPTSPPHTHTHTHSYPPFFFK